MKKQILLISACLLTVFTACKDTSHTHAAVEGWERNGLEHWQLCQCGEEMGRTAHTLAEDLVCTVCGSEVLLFDDGSADVAEYNDNGDMIRLTSFDANGSITYDTETVYVYDDHGNLLKSSTYENGHLSAETEYIVTSDGQWYEAKFTAYNEDGSSLVNQYDESGNTVSLLSYDNAGTLIEETQYTYTSSDSGDIYTESITSIFSDGTSMLTEYNEYGDFILEASYDENGTTVAETRYEYTYDDAGRKLTEARYENNVLTQQLEYAIVEEADGWFSYPYTTTDYFEDGSKQITVCDEAGNETVTQYDASGAVIS